MPILWDQIDELERIRDIKVDEVQEVLKLTRNIYKAFKEASDFLKKQYLGLFWERFEIKDSKIVNSVPTRLFKAIQDDLEASQITHKPVLLERASV